MRYIKTIHLKRYRFFEIGTDHYYYDDYANEQGINEVVDVRMFPALNTLIEMARANGGAFKVAFSISGVELEQLEIHAPIVIELLHQLNDTGCCEFLCDLFMVFLRWQMKTASVKNWNACVRIKQIFQTKRRRYSCNSGRIYSEIGSNYS